MEDEEDAASVDDGTVSTIRRTRLPLHVQKQLARDIEENGGIAHFDGQNQRLSKLLDRLSEGHSLYGDRADPIRKKLRKKVYTWIVLDREGQYVSQVLNPWRIRQWSARDTSKTKTRSSKQQAAAVSSDDISVASSSSSAAASSLSDSSDRATVPAKKRASKKSTPVNQVVLRGKKKAPKQKQQSSPAVQSDLLAESFKKMSLQSPTTTASPAISRPKRKSRWDTIAEQASKFFLLHQKLCCCQ